MFRSIFPAPFSRPFPAVVSAAAGWWLAAGVTPLGAWQAKGTASQAASYVNLASPGTYDLTLGDAPSWDTSTGWGGTTTSYLKTGITPTATEMTWTIIVRFTNANDGGCPMGSRESASASRFHVFPRSTTTRIYTHSNNSLTIAGGNVTSGTMAISNLACYYNGVSDGNMGAATSTAWREIWLMARNNNGSRDAGFTGNVQAAAIYNIELNATQIGLIHNAIAAL